MRCRKPYGNTFAPPPLPAACLAVILPLQRWRGRSFLTGYGARSAGMWRERSSISTPGSGRAASASGPPGPLRWMCRPKRNCFACTRGGSRSGRRGGTRPSRWTTAWRTNGTAFTSTARTRTASRPTATTSAAAAAAASLSRARPA
ncbi:unnamed protein product [Laminaria digitata]